jgi:hypothetical protein
MRGLPGTCAPQVRRNLGDWPCTDWSVRSEPIPSYEDLADEAIKFILDAHVNAPEKPFFTYFGPRLPTAPLFFEIEGLSCGYYYGAPAVVYSPRYRFTGTLQQVTVAYRVSSLRTTRPPCVGSRHSSDRGPQGRVRHSAHPFRVRPVTLWSWTL